MASVQFRNTACGYILHVEFKKDMYIRKLFLYFFYMDEIKLPREMYLTYLRRREMDIENLKKGLSEGSVDPFNTLGHQLLGNASNFGFPELEVIAEKMESLSQQDLNTTGAMLIKDMVSWIERTKVSLGAVT